MTGSRWTSVATALALLVGSGVGVVGSASAGEAAQRQSSGLKGSADRVTFQARPLVSRAGVRTTLFGSIASDRAGEDVKIQGKDCGGDFFRVVSGAITEKGGGWSIFYWPGRNTTLRAVWNGTTSADVVVRRRVSVGLRKRSARRIEVSVYARQVWRKRAFIQRFERRLGTWQAVRSVVLTDGTYGRYSRGFFTLEVPKGTLIRAVFQRSQTGSCYETGTSNSLRI